MRRRILSVVLCAAAGVAAGPQASPFYLGADISALAAPSRFGRGGAPGIYREDGKPSDEPTILMRHGWTAFRLRVFVSPVREAPDNSLAVFTLDHLTDGAGGK